MILMFKFACELDKASENFQLYGGNNLVQTRLRILYNRSNNKHEFNRDNTLILPQLPTRVNMFKKTF